MEKNASNIRPHGATGADHRQRLQMWRWPCRNPLSGVALAALVLLAVGAEGAFAQPLEVSGPGSSQPFVIEPISASAPVVCDPPAEGCFCCRWASAGESGSDRFNLYAMDDLSQLFGGYQFKCFLPGLITNAARCCPQPQIPGKASGYLVQGANAAGAGILGTDSAGHAIPAILPCP